MPSPEGSGAAVLGGVDPPVAGGVESCRGVVLAEVDEEEDGGGVVAGVSVELDGGVESVDSWRCRMVEFGMRAEEATERRDTAKMRAKSETRAGRCRERARHVMARGRGC